MRTRKSALSAEARALAIKAARSISEAPPAVTSIKRSPAFEQLDGLQGAPDPARHRPDAGADGSGLLLKGRPSREIPSLSCVNGAANESVPHFGPYAYVWLNQCLTPEPSVRCSAMKPLSSDHSPRCRILSGSAAVSPALSDRADPPHARALGIALRCRRRRLCIVSGSCHQRLSAIADADCKRDLYAPFNTPVRSNLITASRLRRCRVPQSRQPSRRSFPA